MPEHNGQEPPRAAAEQIRHNGIATLGFIMRDVLPHVDHASQVYDPTQRQRLGNKQWTRVGDLLTGAGAQRQMAAG
jgi:hypothetical protein